MKRFFIFLIVGPILGYIILMLQSGGLKSVSVIFDGLLLFLPFVLMFGLAPALIAAVGDLMLERHGVVSFRRWFATGVTGYLATYILFLNRLFEPYPVDKINYGMGLVGAVAAVACSWLSERSSKIETA